MWYLRCVWVRGYLVLGCRRAAVIFVRFTVPAGDLSSDDCSACCFTRPCKTTSTLYKCCSWLCRPTVSSKLDWSSGHCLLSRQSVSLRCISSGSMEWNFFQVTSTIWLQLQQIKNFRATSVLLLYFLFILQLIRRTTCYWRTTTTTCFLGDPKPLTMLLWLTSCWSINRLNCWPKKREEFLKQQQLLIIYSQLVLMYFRTNHDRKLCF